MLMALDRLSLLASDCSRDVCEKNLSYEELLQSPSIMQKLMFYALDNIPIDNARVGDICEDIKEDLDRMLNG